MKKILVLLTIFCLAACTKWEEFEPIDDKITLEVMYVEVTFDFKELRDTVDNEVIIKRKITVFNKNHGGAEVRISRIINDNRRDYAELFYAWVGGGQIVSEKISFNHGDKIEMRIKIDNWTDEDPVRYSYFKLKSIPVQDSTLTVVL